MESARDRPHRPSEALAGIFQQHKHLPREVRELAAGLWPRRMPRDHKVEGLEGVRERGPGSGPLEGSRSRGAPTAPGSHRGKRWAGTATQPRCPPAPSEVRGALGRYAHTHTHTHSRLAQVWERFISPGQEALAHGGISLGRRRAPGTPRAPPGQSSSRSRHCAGGDGGLLVTCGERNPVVTASRSLPPRPLRGDSRGTRPRAAGGRRALTPEAPYRSSIRHSSTFCCCSSSSSASRLALRLRTVLSRGGQS